MASANKYVCSLFSEYFDSQTIDIHCISLSLMPFVNSRKVVLHDETAAGGTKNCLTASQVNALTKVYEPVFGTNGELLYPRFDPGAEGYGKFMGILSGGVFPITGVSQASLCV